MTATVACDLLTVIDVMKDGHDVVPCAVTVVSFNVKHSDLRKWCECICIERLVYLAKLAN